MKGPTELVSHPMIFVISIAHVSNALWPIRHCSPPRAPRHLPTQPSRQPSQSVSKSGRRSAQSTPTTHPKPMQPVQLCLDVPTGRCASDRSQNFAPRSISSTILRIRVSMVSLYGDSEIGQIELLVLYWNSDCRSSSNIRTWETPNGRPGARCSLHACDWGVTSQLEIYSRWPVTRRRPGTPS